MPRVLLSIMLCMFLTGCESSVNHYTQTVDSWRGGNTKDLERRWGTPYRKIIAQNGASVYVYKTKSYHAQPAAIGPNFNVKLGEGNEPAIYSLPNPNMSWSRGFSNSCIAAFKVNKYGTIIGTQTEGSGCFGSANFAKNMGNPHADVVSS